MPLTELLESGAGPVVRVARNGNSRTLAIPAEIARLAGIEPGDEFLVTPVGDALIYRRAGHQRTETRGEGRDRHAVLARGAVVEAVDDEHRNRPADWDDL